MVEIMVVSYSVAHMKIYSAHGINDFVIYNAS